MCVPPFAHSLDTRATRRYVSESPPLRLGSPSRTTVVCHTSKATVAIGETGREREREREREGEGRAIVQCRVQRDTDSVSDYVFVICLGLGVRRVRPALCA